MRRRRKLLIGVGVLVSLTVGGAWLYPNPCLNLPLLAKFQPVAGWCKSNPAVREVLILVAEFEGGSDLEKNRITDTILDNLKRATEEYKDVKVKALNKTITEQEGSEVAREEGKKQNAAIVIWGGHDKAQTNAPLNVNFEVLEEAKDVSEPNQKVQEEMQTASVAESRSFQVQTQLSEEMTDLSLVVFGLSRYAAGDWDGTIARLTNALNSVKETTIDSAEVYFYRGNAYLEKQDYEKAIADYTQALQLKSNFAPAYSNRGLAYANKQDYDRAIADFNRAIELAPNNAVAYNNRGAAYAKKQDYEKAMADYNRAILLNPNYAGAYNNRGGIYFYQQDYDRAIASFNHALQLNPNDAKTYKNRGLAYFGLQDYEKAMADFNYAIKLNPNLAGAYNNRGLVYRDRQDYEKAMADFNYAIKLNPNLAKIYHNRGLTYALRQDYKKAMADFNRAIKLNPKLAEAYASRGVGYSLKGDKQNAVKDFKKAIELTNDSNLKQIAEDQLQKLGE